MSAETLTILPLSEGPVTSRVGQSLTSAEALSSTSTNRSKGTSTCSSFMMKPTGMGTGTLAVAWSVPCTRALARVVSWALTRFWDDGPTLVSVGSPFLVNAKLEP